MLDVIRYNEFLSSAKKHYRDGLHSSDLLFPLRVPLAPLDLLDSLVALELRYYYG